MARKINLSIDNDLLFDDGASMPITANAAAEVASVDKTIDLGADWEDYGMMMIQVNIGDIDLANADETYRIRLDQSNDSGFASFVQQTFRTIIAGNQTIWIEWLPQGRYHRLFYLLTGTTPSLDIDKAFAGKGAA